MKIMILQIYLCSYVHKGKYNFIKRIIDFYGMKYTEILCRAKGEQYSEIVEQLKLDILIEDDCKSIGGQKEWCITNVKEEIKSELRSIIVHEFKGISEEDMNQLIKDWNLSDSEQQECYRNAVPKQHKMLLDASVIIIPLLKQKDIKVKERIHRDRW